MALGKGPVPIAIAAGEAHTCALLADGAVKCWGGGLHGQLGSGSRDSQGNAPTPALEDAPPVDLGTAGGVPLAATAISAGADHTCALLTSGDLKCWGLNNVGQLGQESTATLGDDRMEMGDNLPPIRLGTPAPP